MTVITGRYVKQPINRVGNQYEGKLIQPILNEMDKELRRLQGSVGSIPSSGAASAAASYLTISLEGDLSNERQFVAGSRLTLTDLGGNSTATLQVNPTPLLDANFHSDTVAQAVTRGSLIYGNATPAWDELAIGAANTFVGSDGTDTLFRTVTGAMISTPRFADNAFRIRDEADSSKLFGFTVDPIATATTRLWTIGNYDLTWPVAQGAASSYLKNDGAGGLSWDVLTAASFTHALLSATVHTDTVTQAVSRGSLIYGNVTPAWDELTIGASGRILRSDGTDVAWTDFESLIHSWTNTNTFLDLRISNGSFSAIFDPTPLTADRTYTFPDFDGTVVLTGGAQTLTSKTMAVSTILLSSTASSGVSFTDNVTATKKLRMVLSGAVGNNSFTLTNTAARNYEFRNYSGMVMTPPTEGTSGQVLTSNGAAQPTFQDAAAAGTTSWLRHFAVMGA